MLSNKMNGVLLGAAALFGAATLSADVANAYNLIKIDQQYTVSFSDLDIGSDGGSLSANLTQNSKNSELNIWLATSNYYNARVSARCSDGHLKENAPRNVLGAKLFVTKWCDGNSFVLRTEGALDDL